MKKLIFVLALGVAAFAQAEYLYWTVLESDWTSTDIDEVAYMRVGYVKNNGSDQPAWSGTTLTAYQENGTVIGNNVAYDSGTAGDWGFKVDVTGLNNSSYGFYIELLNSSYEVVGRTGSEEGFTYDTYASLSSANHISTGTISDVPSVNVWHGTFEAVPEPSSMALLALGAGLVGLRRKLRKGKKGKRA